MPNGSGADPASIEEGLAEVPPRRRRGRSLNDVFTATRMLSMENALGPYRRRIAAFLVYMVTVLSLLYLVRVYAGAVRAGWPSAGDAPLMLNICTT